MKISSNYIRYFIKSNQIIQIDFIELNEQSISYHIFPIISALCIISLFFFPRKFIKFLLLIYKKKKLIIRNSLHAYSTLLLYLKLLKIVNEKKTR